MFQLFPRIRRYKGVSGVEVDNGATMSYDNYWDNPEEYSMDVADMTSSHSFGRDFNIIRAVSEYGPQRVDSIKKELVRMRDQMEKLELEMATLQRLIDVVNETGA